MIAPKVLLEDLTQGIAARTATIGVVGLGYVGLPAACMFAGAGLRVVGVDLNAERIDRIRRGISPIEGDEPGLAELLEQVVAAGRLEATTEHAALAAAQIILIVVETPVEADHMPRFGALRSAATAIGRVMARGSLVIVESTVAPGTVTGVVQPLLEAASGFTLNRDFFLGACPERVMPGRLLSNMRNVSRVCGGSSPETSRAMATLYRTIVEATVDETDIVTAEMVKTVENAYRDVQIAFANEVARICETTGANIWTVREFVNKSPGRHMLMPGAGVGGHCIPKDPWLLASSVAGKVDLRLIPAARAVNDAMPRHIADLLCAALAEAHVAPEAARVAILGYAYLEESDDTRNSPTQSLCNTLDQWGVRYVLHDPWVEDYRGNLNERIAGCDALVVMVRHRDYLNLDLDAIRAEMSHAILIDGRNVVEPAVARNAGFVYRGVGRGEYHP